MKYLAIICALVLGTTAKAQDDCTPDAIQTKSAQVSSALQTIRASDPARVQELAGEIEELMTSIQSGADITTVCTFFDKVISEAAG